MVWKLHLLKSYHLRAPWETSLLDYARRNLPHVYKPLLGITNEDTDEEIEYKSAEGSTMNTEFWRGVACKFATIALVAPGYGITVVKDRPHLVCLPFIPFPTVIGVSHPWKTKSPLFHDEGEGG